MNIAAILELADRLVVARTGKHLDNLQQAILRGAWNQQKYSEIAKSYHCSKGHVKDTASELWQLLSSVLEEEVSKANIRATLERLQFSKFSKISNYGQDFIHINNVNLCDNRDPPKSSPPQNPELETPQPTDTKYQKVFDLNYTPEIYPFYDRTQELALLEKSIVQQHCRLISIYGMSGIGKTALAVQLVDRFRQKFDAVLWGSLRDEPPLDAILADAIQCLNNGNKIETDTSKNSLLSQLIELLRQKRCLIVLDDVDDATCHQEDYHQLFEILGISSHNSCLLLLGWEKPRTVTKLEGETAPVRSLQLNGLGLAAKEIFREKGLKNEEKWDEAIALYGGNPLWLKLIAATINDLFGGRVGEFLTYDSLFLSEDITAVLDPQFRRLSEPEKMAIAALANAAPVSLSQLREETELSPSDLLKAMQSLSRRCLIETPDSDQETVFSMQPILKAYVKLKILRSS
jgi:hypothetical protein